LSQQILFIFICFLSFIRTSHVSVIAGHPQTLNALHLNLKTKTKNYYTK